MKLTLTEQRANVLTSALMLAAERYDADVVVCREASQERLALQFERQAKDARDMMVLIESVAV